MPYKFDIWVPFYVKVSSVVTGSLNTHIGLNTDLALTILDLTGLDSPWIRKEIHPQAPGHLATRE